MATSSSWMVGLSVVTLTTAGAGCATAVPLGPDDGPEGLAIDGGVGCSRGKMCDGKCIDPLSDPKNCNACGHTCQAGYGCKNALCVQLTCSGSLTNCADAGAGTKCVDTSNDVDNCGTCGNPCGAGEVCQTGVCTSNCAAPTTSCSDDAGASCVDVTQDDGNCGKCGHACPMAATCTAGVCVCPSPQSLCGPDCVDTTSDDNDCGGCGKPCASGKHCSGGTCVSEPTLSTVFVSSKVYAGGSLGGLSGADADCQSLATAAKLTGSYRAWLSDSKTDASSRFGHWSTPYVLVDGTTKVANDWSGLTGGTLLHAINQTETGGAPPSGTIGASAVWTNSNTTGTTYSSTDCSDWTDPSGSVGVNFHFGQANLSTSAWTLNASSSYGLNWCNHTAAVYCISQ